MMGTGEISANLTTDLAYLGYITYVEVIINSIIVLYFKLVYVEVSNSENSVYRRVFSFPKSFSPSLQLLASKSKVVLAKK